MMYSINKNIWRDIFSVHCYLVKQSFLFIRKGSSKTFSFIALSSVSSLTDDPFAMVDLAGCSATVMSNCTVYILQSNTEAWY